MGDIVDRGEHALEAWDCLSNLQATSPAGSEVVRLVGNHELMWLYGDHKVGDEPAKKPTHTCTRAVFPFHSGL